MSDFINKISLYDQLSFIVVGGIFYAFLSYDLLYFGLDLEKLLNNAFEVGVAIYFLGHVAQAIANVFIKEKKGAFSPSQQEILDKVKQHFSIPNHSYPEAFGICYLWAVGADKTGHVTEMNAKYGLYRGWLVILSLQSIFYAGTLVYELFIFHYRGIGQFNMAYFTGILFTIPLSILMLNRSRRFFKLIGEKTLQTFLISNIQKDEGKI